jgi:hypothetical protein
MADISEKIMTLREAVQRFIKPGTHLALGGFTILRRPMGFAREIVRQNIGGLFVTMNGGTLAEEMLAGAGLIKYLESTYLGLRAACRWPTPRGLRLKTEKSSLWKTTATGALPSGLWRCVWACPSCRACRIWAATFWNTMCSGKPGCAAATRTAIRFTAASRPKNTRLSTTRSTASACAPHGLTTARIRAATKQTAISSRPDSALNGIPEKKA